MGLFTKDIKSMDDLFLHVMQDIYYAEKQILKALPDMIEKATDAQLKAGFEKHLAETEGQIERLRQVFELLDADPKGDKCPAIEGILKEGKELMSEIEGDDLMDVGLIAAASISTSSSYVASSSEAMVRHQAHARSNAFPPGANRLPRR